MVQVVVNDGLLEGEVVHNEYGGTFCSFKGIPYAQPPIGDLRFKPRLLSSKNPTPDGNLGIKWKPYTIEAQDYLDIGNELIAGRSPDKEENDMWEKVFQEFLPNFSFSK
uniref:Carboxylesterase type B domain-containing protein n=1 Tax=Heliothis virescens TaxID=7102 RepID=A0A2A4JES7_HELVI